MQIGISIIISSILSVIYCYWLINDKEKNSSNFLTTEIDKDSSEAILKKE